MMSKYNLSSLGFILMALVMPLTSMANSALKIDVFIQTSDEQNIYVPMNRRVSEFNVYRVDALKIVEEKMSQGLSATPSEAKEQALEMMNSEKFRNEYSIDMMEGWSVINKVVRLGVKKVPAVVINNKYIAYGVTPKEAVTIYDNHIIRYGNQHD